MTPKVQLIIPPEDYVSVKKVESFAEEYNRVDVIFRKNTAYHQDTVKKLTKNNVHFHFDVSDNKISQILNRIIDKDMDFYCVFGTNDVPAGFVGKLNSYLSDFNTPLMLIRPNGGLHGMVVNTGLSEYLCHFGEQTVDEKIYIHLINNNLRYMMFDTVEDFIRRADTNG